MAARASELPIGRQSQVRGRHQIESSFSGFGVLGPKIFSACGALLGRLRRAGSHLISDPSQVYVWYGSQRR